MKKSIGVLAVLALASPWMAAAHLCGRDGGQTGGCRHAEQSGEEAATWVRAGVMHGQLLGDNGFT